MSYWQMQAKPYGATGPQRARGPAGFPDKMRTSRNHAGEGIADGWNIPGVLLFAVGIVALAVALTAGGYGFLGWAVAAGVVCLGCLLSGAVWIAVEHRRIKDHEGLALRDQLGH